MNAPFLWGNYGCKEIRFNKIDYFLTIKLI